MTAADIKKGKKYSCNLCPVGLAIARRTGVMAIVGVAFIQIYNPYTFVFETFITPDNVQTFLRKFDNGLPVNPIRFELVLDWLDKPYKE
ncbi:MAG: hypothetical protein JRN15_21685 [Nitrososphaerota archaeon]|nr:hypothetical protein [Nitrososphaerota archaeon]